MGKYTEAGYTEPLKALGIELDNTMVISQEFKSRLWALTMWAVREAYERGQKAQEEA